MIKEINGDFLQFMWGLCEPKLRNVTLKILRELLNWMFPKYPKRRMSNTGSQKHLTCFFFVIILFEIIAGYDVFRHHTPECRSSIWSGVNQILNNLIFF